MASGKSKILRQACAIPYRMREGALEFCLITTGRKKRLWGFPKGLIEWGETAVEAALKEAWEEAGLRGRIEGEPLGRFKYSKWGNRLSVAVFAMLVDDEDDRWPEARFRNRQWSSASDALALLHRKSLRRLLIAAVDRLSTSSDTQRDVG